MLRLATLELGDVEASTKAVQRMLDLKPSLPSYGRAAHLRWLLGDTAGAQALYQSLGYRTDAIQMSKPLEEPT